MGTLQILVLTLCCMAVFAQRITINIGGRTPRVNMDSADWMSNNNHWLGSRTLKQICLPGSRNSGMNQYKGGTEHSKPCNTLTQSLTVQRQLENGVRYLDLRPVIFGGRLLTGNYQMDSGSQWKGGNGQSLDEIIEDINTFTERHNELILIRIFQPLRAVDIDTTNIRELNEQEWDRLLRFLDRTNNLFYTTDLYLPSLTLGRFTAQGTRAAVVFIIDSPNTGVNLGGRWGRGYYYPQNIQTYSRDSNTNDLRMMAEDQIRTMLTASQNRQYFLLSWFLSQKSQDVAMCDGKRSKSIQELANFANLKLKEMILPVVNTRVIPNVLLVDNVISAYIMNVAMEINKNLLF